MTKDHVQYAHDIDAGLADVFKAIPGPMRAYGQLFEEATKTGDHVLTQEEALELAWAKNAIREREKELKKITPREVWRDMLAIQYKSLSEHKAKVAKERKETAKKKQASEILFLATESHPCPKPQR